MFSASSASGSSTESQASTIVRAVSGSVRFRLITRTFASFQRLAPSAIHGSHASAARTPGTLFAAMDVPVRPAEEEALVGVPRRHGASDPFGDVGPLVALEHVDVVARP